MDSVTFWKIIVQSLMFIIVGILILFYVSKQEKKPLTSVKFKGYAAGVAFILLGVIHFLNEFLIW
jgi:membrane-associated HD superfamily phosphohydrolase